MNFLLCAHLLSTIYESNKEVLFHAHYSEIHKNLMHPVLDVLVIYIVELCFVYFVCCAEISTLI